MFSGTLICAAAVIGHETVCTSVVKTQTFCTLYKVKSEQNQVFGN